LGAGVRPAALMGCGPAALACKRTVDRCVPRRLQRAAHACMPPCAAPLGCREGGPHSCRWCRTAGAPAGAQGHQGGAQRAARHARHARPGKHPDNRSQACPGPPARLAGQADERAGGQAERGQQGRQRVVRAAQPVHALALRAVRRRAAPHVHDAACAAGAQRGLRAPV